MANNPFENATTNEEQATAPEKENKNMAVNTEGKVVVTLKGGKGYEAPWIVIHADSIEDAHAQVNDAKLGELIDQTKKVAGYFNQGDTTAQAVSGPKGQPQAATQAPGGKTPPEGYEYKSGIGKNGRAWQAFMPLDRSSGLDPIWLDAQGNPRN